VDASYAPKAKDDFGVDCFETYIESWAAAHGLDCEEAKAQMRCWAQKIGSEESDLEKLSLAGFVDKNFHKAKSHYAQSAETKARELESRTRDLATLRADVVRRHLRAGVAAEYDYRFRDALAQYQKALDQAPKESGPQLWAEVSLAFGTAQWELGIRAAGDESQELLASAVGLYKALLTVYTRVALPQHWAKTTRNLAATYKLQKDWPNAYSLYKALYEFDPEDADAYTNASYLLHEVSFDFKEALALAERSLSTLS
jgi:tetratricopeptide (TPR) repeat protein